MFSVNLNPVVLQIQALNNNGIEQLHIFLDHIPSIFWDMLVAKWKEVEGINFKPETW